MNFTFQTSLCVEENITLKMSYCGSSVNGPQSTASVSQTSMLPCEEDDGGGVGCGSLTIIRPLSTVGGFALQSSSAPVLAPSSTKLNSRILPATIIRYGALSNQLSHNRFGTDNCVTHSNRNHHHHHNHHSLHHSLQQHHQHRHKLNKIVQLFLIYNILLFTIFIQCKFV